MKTMDIWIKRFGWILGITLMLIALTYEPSSSSWLVGATLGVPVGCTTAYIVDITELKEEVKK